MRIAKWDIGDGDLFPDVLRFGYRDVLVGKSGAADLLQAAVVNQHSLCDAEAVADSFERFALAGFGTLAIADVHGGNTVCTMFVRGDGDADARIHASAEQDDGT